MLNEYTDSNLFHTAHANTGNGTFVSLPVTVKRRFLTITAASAQDSVMDSDSDSTMDWVSLRVMEKHLDSDWDWDQGLGLNLAWELVSDFDLAPVEDS